MQVSEYKMNFVFVFKLSWSDKNLRGIIVFWILFMCLLFITFIIIMNLLLKEGEIEVICWN